MTRGRELPVNSRVRRRLFSEDEPDLSTQNGNDDYNRIEETFFLKNLCNEMTIKGMKWNFDFRRETALEGPIKWFKKSNSDEWVGMQPSQAICIQDRMNEAEYKMNCRLYDRQTLDFAMEQGRTENYMNEMIEEKYLDAAPEFESASTDLSLDYMDKESPDLSKDIKQATDSFEYPKQLKEANNFLMGNCVKLFKPADMKIDKTIELIKDGNESDHDYLANNKFEDLKISDKTENNPDTTDMKDNETMLNNDEYQDNRKFKELRISDNTDDNQCFKEEQTDIKDINEATPKSNSYLNGLHHKRKMLTTARIQNEMTKKRRLLL